jgi:hypothetical protein
MRRFFLLPFLILCIAIPGCEAKTEEQEERRYITYGERETNAANKNIFIEKLYVSDIPSGDFYITNLPGELLGENILRDEGSLAIKSNHNFAMQIFSLPAQETPYSSVSISASNYNDSETPKEYLKSIKKTKDPKMIVEQVQHELFEEAYLVTMEYEYSDKLNDYQFTGFNKQEDGSYKMFGVSNSYGTSAGYVPGETVPIIVLDKEKMMEMANSIEIKE